MSANGEQTIVRPAVILFTVPVGAAAEEWLVQTTKVENGFTQTLVFAGNAGAARAMEPHLQPIADKMGKLIRAVRYVPEDVLLTVEPRLILPARPR